MLENFQLAGRQSAPAFTFEGVLARHLRIENSHASSDALYRAHQVEVHGVFQNVAARARLERLAHQRFLGMHAQHENSRFRIRFKDFSRRFNAAQFGHGAIHHDDARPQVDGQAHGFFAVARFGDDRDPLVVFQHTTEAAPNQGVIVRQQNRYFMRHDFPLSHAESATGHACRPGDAER